MQVAGPATQLVLEVMVLKVAQVVRHIRPAGQKGFLPYCVAGAPDTRRAANICRQFTDPELRPQRSVTQVGMRQIQVVHPLGHVIGKFAGERESKPTWCPVRRNDVDTRKLRLLSAVECKFR